MVYSETVVIAEVVSASSTHQSLGTAFLLILGKRQTAITEQFTGMAGLGVMA